MTKRVLTEQQQKFLELLFLSVEEGGAAGDAVLAKRLAGYHPGYSTKMVVASLKDEIVEATKNYFVQVGPKAAMKISGVMDDPTQLGTKEMLMAAKELLDRGGLGKTENVNVTSSGGGVLLLPQKREQEEE